MAKSVALFGGTGFVGSYVVDALLEAGHEPSLLVRPGSEEKVRQPERCRLITGDVRSDAAIDETLGSCDSVIFLIGILKEYKKQGITFEALQYEAVVRVAKSAKAKGIKRFLLMSANGVKARGTPYQETKYLAEQYLENDDFDVTVFRPSVIFGDPRGATEIATQLYQDMVVQPFPAVGFYTGWIPGRNEVRMSPVHVEDVATGYVHALEDRSTIGNTCELGGPDELTWSEMIRRVARTVGSDKRILPMPIGLMRLAATLFDWLPFFPVTRDQVTMLAEGNTAHPFELEALIGRPPRSFTPENLRYLQARI